MRRIFFYGDSNTYGYDPRGYLGGRYPETSRWTYLLQQKLEGKWKIEADGMNGRTIPYTRIQIDDMLRMIDQLQPLDVYAVFLGTNDLWNMARPDAAKPVKRLEHAIELVYSLPSVQRFETKIMIVVPPQMRMEDDGFTDRAAYMRASGIMAEQFSGIASRRGCLLANAYAWNLDLAYDGVHLSEEGHRQFAGRIAEIIISIS